MSALRGFANPVTGRIAVGGVAPASFWRGIGFLANGRMRNSGVADPGMTFNGSVNVNPDGSVLTNTGGTIANYVGGLPLTPEGALAVEVSAPVTFSQGVGFTAAGRVAVE